MTLDLALFLLLALVAIASALGMSFSRNALSVWLGVVLIPGYLITKWLKVKGCRLQV